MFEITNETNGATIITNGDGWARLKAAIDVSAAEMREKAAKETDPQRKRMMLLYARRKAKIEQGAAKIGP